MKPQITLGLIDPNLLMRQGLISLLKNHRHIRIAFDVENSQQMLHALKKVQPDIILMSIELPGMQDFETLRKMGKKYPQSKIILLTTQLNDAFILEILALGVKAYLLKSTPVNKLMDAIAAVHERGFFYAHEVTQVIDRQITTLVKQGTFNTNFSAREKEILRLLRFNKSSPEIAENLSISTRTVEGHRQRLMRKTGATNLATLKEWASKYL